MTAPEATAGRATAREPGGDGVRGRSPRGVTAPEAPTRREAIAALCAVIEPLPGDPRELAARHVGRVAPLATALERDEVVDGAVAHLVGLGPLERFLTDADVDEVMVNGAGDIWLDRDGGLLRAGSVTPDELATSLERILAPLGRRLDRTSPIVDARLPDGSRVCAIVPPVAVDGTTLTIRRFRRGHRPLDDFGGPQTVAVLEELARERCNVIVSGATSSGKSSLLGAVLGTVGDAERIVLVEDTAELSLRSANLVRLEARAASADGVRAVALDELVRTALRLRPDRLIVGEVRGSEVVAMVQALNTGHDGSWSTCHANSALDALHRLEALILQAAPSWPLAAIRQHLYRSIDAVVHTRRSPDGRRRVVEIGEVDPASQVPTTLPVVVDEHVVGRLSRSRQ